MLNDKNFKNQKIVFAYVSEHRASFETKKNLIWPLLTEEGGGSTYRSVENVQYKYMYVFVNICEYLYVYIKIYIYKYILYIYIYAE